MKATKIILACLFVATMALPLFAQEEFTQVPITVVPTEVQPEATEVVVPDVVVEDGGTVIINPTDPSKEPWEIALIKFFGILGAGLVALRMGIKALIEFFERLGRNTLVTSLAEQGAERVKQLAPEPFKEQMRETREDAERLRVAVNAYLTELFDGQPMVLKKLQEQQPTPHAPTPPENPLL